MPAPSLPKRFCRRGSLIRRIHYASAGGLALVALLAVGLATGLAWRSGDVPAAAPALMPGTADIAERTQPRQSSIDYRLIDQRLQQLIAEDAMVGLAVGIVENGEIRFLKGYGVTDTVSNQPVTANTIFRWASVSKGVAADMVAQLAAEDKLSLYEPISNYSASLRLPGGSEHKATITDVLSHRLGIFGHANDSKLEDGADARMLRGDLGTLSLICPPGSCHAYQNVAYDAVTEVVEKVTGKPYEEAVRQELFLPLGMTSATISRDGLLTAPSWARPHRGGKKSKPVEVTDSYYRVPAAGGVNSSIKDLAIWMKAQMGLEPDILSPKALASVQSPRAATPGEMARKRKFRERISNATYGLGWRVYDYAGHTVVGHRGGVTGYRSLVLFDPELKSGVVAMWNSSSAKPGAVEFEVMDMVYRLPPRDWLDLGTSPGAPPTEAAAETGEAEEANEQAGAEPAA